MRGKTKSSNCYLLLRIALILLCMVAFSTSMLAGLYARYASKTSGGDAARVARFRVEAKWSPDGTDWSPDVTVDASESETEGKYLFTVDNQSEVAISYDLVITFDTLPAYVDVVMEGGSIVGEWVGNTVTFPLVAVLDPGEEDQQRSVSFLLDVDAFTAEANGISYTVPVSYTATIRCQQRD